MGVLERGQYRPDAAQRCRAYVTGRPCMEKGACLSGPKETCGTFLSLGLALVLSFVPSPAHKQVKQRHAIRQEAREKEKEIQKVMDALKQTDTSSMTKEQKKALQELIQSLALSQKKCSRQIRSRHWHLPGRNFLTSMDRRHRFPGRMPWHRYLKISR